MSNPAKQCCNGLMTPRLIIGKCKPDVETGKCVRASKDSGCCGANGGGTLGVNPASTQAETANKSCADSCCDPDEEEKSIVDCKDSCCGDTNDNRPALRTDQRHNIETTNKSCAGSCCDGTPEDEKSTTDDCKDSCCGDVDTNNQSGADQCCNVEKSADKSCAGSCCDSTPDEGEKSFVDCKASCCGETNNNQAVLHAGQRHNTETENKPCASSCCGSILGGEKSIGSCKDSCCGDMNNQPALLTERRNTKFGCGGLCCEQDITEPNGSIALNPGVRGDACITSCCAPEVFLHNHTDSKVGAGRNAGAHASGSSYPPQASTMRRRIGKEVNHKGHKHHHGKHNGKHHCASTVFGRFYEVACCCVLNSLKSASSEASKRKQSAAQPKPPSDSLLDIERAGGEDVGRIMKMSIQGMDCPSCGRRLAKALHTLPSVREAKVNALAGEATLLYSDAIITPAEIARRAYTLTGFRCEAIDEKDDSLTNSGAGASRVRRLRVQVSAMHPEGISGIAPPPGVTIHSAKRSGKDKWILDLDYDSKVIQPRTVLTNFAQFHGVHVPRSHGSASDAARKDLINLLMRTMISIICCIPVLIFSWAPIPPHPITYGSISLAFTTIIQFYVALPIYSSALRSVLFLHMIDMELLVAVSTSIAYIYSVVAFALQAAGRKFSDQFFETSALLVTLIMLGRLVSAYAHRKASSALDDLAALQPREVIIVHPSTDGSSTSTISEELVHTGDVLRILPDTLVPTDGVVLVGSSEVDESSITGESIPVTKQPGSSLVAGTLNLSGVLDMQITRVPAESTLADIAKLLRDAQEAAAALPVQDRADRAAAYLAPVVFALSIATFVIWMLVGVYVRHDTKHAAIVALKYAITVMVVSCPCAIVLAVPMVVVLAVSVASKRGVLFKSVLAVQFAKDVSVAVFDKTGTLTEGMPHVVQARLLRGEAADLVLALTSASKHPISKAVAKYLSSTLKNSLELEGLHSIPGSGIEARYDNKPLRGGSPKWLGLDSHPAVVEMKSERLTLFVVTHGGEIIASFGLQDGLREGAREAINMLQRRGVEVHIVSGDEPGVVSALAADLKLDPKRAVGGCKPQDKQEYIEALRTASGGGKRSPRRVMFFGDGTNDSLALVQADVGVSLSSGTDVAMSAAGIVFMDAKNLERSIRTTLDISEGAVLRIKGNLAWSVVYNTFAILLASGVFVHARISPQYAGLGEMVSVLPVVLIAWSMMLLKK